jgi:hypothetical protein
MPGNPSRDREIFVLRGEERVAFFLPSIDDGRSTTPRASFRWGSMSMAGVAIHRRDADVVPSAA